MQYPVFLSNIYLGQVWVPSLLVSKLVDAMVSLQFATLFTPSRGKLLRAAAVDTLNQYAHNAGENNEAVKRIICAYLQLRGVLAVS